MLFTVLNWPVHCLLKTGNFNQIFIEKIIKWNYERLFLAVPWGCLRFVIVVFPDHTHLLFFMYQEINDFIGWDENITYIPRKWSKHKYL